MATDCYYSQLHLLVPLLHDNRLPVDVEDGGVGGRRLPDPLHHDLTDRQIGRPADRQIDKTAGSS